ncbi:hypothetical protein OIU77_024013 [Salix suchowensis]|uniref:Uncharacterized protein n=1 Tax=Salix suchowensis TaxID=1278906 RepID=A0ABQ9C9K4_9ROSI|nr:hypothetical protein OIU77_024013 [Salix suchowensis]
MELPGNFMDTEEYEQEASPGKLQFKISTQKNVVRSGPATSTSTTTQDSLSVLEEDQENNVEERFSMKLRRNPSVSSSTSALQSAVKKAFSMGRSTSVSARYCRIHSQSITHP